MAAKHDDIARFDRDMDGSMEPVADGEWVRYDDIADVAIQRDALMASLEAIVEAGRLSDQPRAIYCADIARAAISKATGVL